MRARKSFAALSATLLSCGLSRNPIQTGLHEPRANERVAAGDRSNKAVSEPVLEVSRTAVRVELEKRIGQIGSNIALDADVVRVSGLVNTAAAEAVNSALAAPLDRLVED